jgi:ABC-type nitrate/sulfonate/bicarbonate transport system permease component
MKMKDKSISFVSSLFGIVLLFYILPKINNNAFTSLPEMLEIESGLRNDIFYAGLITFLRCIVSIILGYVTGVLLSIPFLISKTLGIILNPWYNILRIMPTIVWLPLLLIVKVPTEYLPTILGIIFSSLFVSLNVTKELNEIPVEEKMEMKAMKRGKKWKLEYSYFPRIVVTSIDSLRLGGSVAFILVIVGESMLFAENSLGSLLSSFQATRSIPAFWLTTIIIAIIATIIFSICNLLNKKISK